VTEEYNHRKKIDKIVAECFYGNAHTGTGTSSSQMLISRRLFDILSELSSEYMK
jgi:hypothetical protein